jgi:nucleotide-binding universal stress UspA family protein
VQILAEYIAQALAYGRHHLAEQLSADVLQRLNPEILVECGSAAETILATALKRDVRLIVMGARRSLVDSISTHWPWATASLVICGAHCPVLTVRG